MLHVSTEDVLRFSRMTTFQRATALQWKVNSTPLEVEGHHYQPLCHSAFLYVSVCYDDLSDAGQLGS